MEFVNISCSSPGLTAKYLAINRFAIDFWRNCGATTIVSRIWINSRSLRMRTRDNSRMDFRRSLVDRWSRIEVGTRSSVKRSRLPSQVRFHLARTYLRNLYSHARTVSSNRRCTINYLDIWILTGCTYYWYARNVSQLVHLNMLVLSTTFLLIHIHDSSNFINNELLPNDGCRN